MAINTFNKNDLSRRLSQHYTVGDLWLDKNMVQIKLDDALITALEKFLEHFGKVPCFESKRAIYAVDGHTSGSYHYKGMAADFYIEGVTPLALAQYAEVIGMGGIGVYADTTRHIHMDTRPSRACWWVITTDSHTPGFGGKPCVYKKGDRSPAIKLIQQQLKVSADGIFGVKTESALKQWQADKRLTADGIFGKSTNASMKLFSWG